MMQNNSNSMTQRSSLMDQKFSTLDPQAQTGGPMLAENIIDLEAHDLTNGQVKAIHGQIKRDCSLLRNRVRMLQTEMSKANKKIEETKKKTYDIRLIKEENDRKYLMKLEKQREAQEAAERNRLNMERRMKLSQDVRERRYQMFLNKRRETDEYKL